MQPPASETKQECGACCFSKFKGKGIVKGVLLILLGLIIAVPWIGQLVSQYFHIILGALFIAWGVFVLFLKK